MTLLTLPDFKSCPLLLVDCEARSLEALEKSLPRMGMRWHTVSRDGDIAEGPFCGALVELEHFASPRVLARLNAGGLPVVALMSHEALSQIQRAIALGATALLHKPINQRAIYTTLMMAIGLRQQLNQDGRELDVMRRRLDSAPLLSQTLAALMVERDISEEDAYAWLRSESMRCNWRIDELCQSLQNRRRRKWRGGC